MTFLGKIVIVVQVVLSLMFMAFAGAVFSVQTNWKTRAEGLQTRLEEDGKSLNQQITDLQDKNTELDSGMKDEEDEKRRFEAKAGGLEAQLAQLQEENRKDKEALAQVTEQARVNGDEAEERRKEAEKIRNENKRLIAVTGQQAKLLRTKEDEIYTIELASAAGAKKHVSLLGEVKDLKDFIASIGKRFDPEEIKAGKTLPPVVTGVVVAVRKNKRGRIEMVEISLGSDDGLARGHSLSIYRTIGKGKYLGEIRMVYITPDRAVGIIIDRAKTGIIQKGDNVTTKL
ncbi:MAG: hypothetical protein IID46_12650 [Planctomycetes bacterium]|nr:hypothetical protein [Planctomycetota bacterium]